MLNKPPLKSYLLPAKALASLSRGSCGKLTPLVTSSHPTQVTVWDTFDQVLRRSGRALWEVRANEAGVIADHDTEFLHHYRIGLRKIRLILGLFEGF